jgi:hypothetical protein
MSGDKLELPWYAGGRGGEEGEDGDGGSTFISRGSWSVLDDEEGIERAVEILGAGDEARDSGSGGDVERGDERVDEIVLAKLTVELFGGWGDVVDNLVFRRLLADCLTFSLHRVVALTHSFDLTRYSFSESMMLCGVPLILTSFFSKSFRS